eukprot:6472238-Amphidinium_carterae.3
MCNSTAWSSMLEQMRDWELQNSMPHVLAMQEHHLKESDIPRARLQTVDLGFRMLFTAALPTQFGTRAGVAIGARTYVGRQSVPSPEEACLDGRVCAAKFNLGVPGGVTIISVYLTPGATMEVTRNELHALLHMVRRTEGPWIVCGDWNQAPHQLREWRFAEAAGGELHHTSLPTCTAGVGRVLDYFLIAHELSPLVLSLERIEDSITTPHWAVRLTLRRTKAEDQVRVRRKKCKFPEHRPCGPLRWQPLPVWKESLEQPCLASCWKEWSLAAEDWLQGALDMSESSAAWSHRGKGPEYRERLENDAPSLRWALRACHKDLQMRLEPLVLAGVWWTVGGVIHEVAFEAKGRAAAMIDLVTARAKQEARASALQGAAKWRDWVHHSMAGGA